MSQADQGIPESADDLQFDQAEYTGEELATATCTVCHEPIADYYYEIAEKVVCEPCRQAVEASLRGGSKVRRFVRATSFGLVMGALGCAVYYGVLKLTGYHFSLISIAVGYMVGKAVSHGSDGRGGLFYQLLAVFLTYTAIVGTFIPMIVPLVMEHAEKEKAAARGVPAPGKAAAQAAGAQPAAQPAPAQPPRRPLNPLMLVVLWVVLGVVLLVAAYALPFYMLTSSPLLILIIFFALQQAWWLNRQVKLKFAGPFQVGGLPSDSPEPGYA